MARYGGGSEDFNASRDALGGLKSRLTDVERKEAQVTAGMEDLGAATDKATAKRQQLNRARSQGKEIIERESAVASQETAAIDIDTAAIERNRAARERRAVIAKRESIDLQRALRGAGDPLFGQAAAVQQGGGGIRQYRQQLGIGYSRARALEDALTLPNAAGTGPAFRPSGSLAVGANTRAEAATQARVEADIAYSDASRRYTAAVRAGNAAAATKAEADKAAADAARRSADAETKAAAAASEESIARRQLAEAEAVAAKRAEEAAAAYTPGNALIPHPTQFGQPAYGQAVAIPGARGPNGEMLVGRPPAGIQETYAGGAYPPRPGSGGAPLRDESLRTAGNAEQAFMASLNKDQRAIVIANRERAQLAQTNLAQRVEQETGAFQRQSAILGTTSQAMYKHGALTQEFVLAAARGETTLRELGNQAVVTAGKFGGWTLAATALFGAARAIGDIGKGAIAAQSGVATLQRFIPNLDKDRATRGFIDTSRSLNVPVEEVAQSQGVFARVFDNQRDSLTATQTAIKAYKLDQIDAADSTRYFTAITQEFGLNAQRLPLLFDQISAAQRRMGARVSETLPAIARSSAAVKNAGGDLSQLIALAATAQVASGQTGNVVGTAFTRSAANFSRNPANQEVIRSFGIETNKGYTQLLIDAVRRSQSLSGEQRTELAKAIGGPQYGGRIFQTLLGQQDRLSNALNVTSPQNARGSAAEELHHQLQRVDEQISKLGVSLQDLGAALSRSGALNFVGLFLHGLNDTLGLTVRLVELFDKLPSPLRDSLSVLGEIAIAMRLMRRFAPESLVNSRIGSVATGGQDALTRTRVLRGLRDTRGFARDESERSSRNAAGLASAAERQRLAAQRAEAELVDARAATATGGLAAQQRLVTAETEFAAQEARYARISDRAAQAAVEAGDAAAIAASADEQYLAARKKSAAELRVAATAVYVPRELGTPSQKGVTTVGGKTPGGIIVPPGTQIEEQAQVIGTAEQEVQNVEREASTLSARGQAVQRRLTGYYAGLTTRIRGVGEGGTNLGASARLADRAAQRGIQLAGAGTSAVEGAATRLRGMGQQLSGVASSLGLLDIAFIAFIAGDFAINKLLDARANNLKEVDRLNARAPSQRTQQAQRAAALNVTRQNGQTGAIADLVGTAATAGLGPFHFLGPSRTASVVTQDVIDHLTGQIWVKRAAETDNRTADFIKRSQAQERATGSPVVLQTYDQLTKQVNSDAKMRSEGLISQREFDRRMGLHAIEAQHLLDAGAREVGLANAAITAARRGSGDILSYRQSLVNLDDKTFAQEAQAVTQAISDLGLTRRNVGEARAVYADAIRRYGGKGDSASMVALAQVRDAFFQSIVQEAEADTARTLSAGGSEASRQAAYARAANVYRRNLIAPARSRLSAARARLQSARDNFQGARDALDAGPQGIAGPRAVDPLAGPQVGLDFGTLPGQTARDLRKRADQDAKEVARFKGDVANFHREFIAAKRKYADVMQQLKDTSYQDREQGRQIDQALATSRVSDPLDQAVIAVRFARQQVADATRTYGVKSRQYRQALTDLNNAQVQQADTIRQDAADIANLQSQLAQAQTHDPVAAARIALSAARQALGTARTRKERLQAMLDIANAQNQLTDSIAQVTSARFDLLESRTTDPVATARLELRKAQANLRGKSGADRLSALADVNRARQGLRDATLQGKEDDIDFEQEMGKIDVQTAVERYQALLHTRNLTKQQRRDIQRKIHSLSQETDSEASGFDLDVGNLKLPTIYDVRRALDPVRDQINAAKRHGHEVAMGTMGASSYVPGPGMGDISANVQHLHQSRSDVQATIIVNVKDKAAAGEVYTQIDRALGTHLRARMRSKRMR